MILFSVISLRVRLVLFWSCFNNYIWLAWWL